jgi:hypothetical protein
VGGVESLLAQPATTAHSDAEAANLKHESSFIFGQAAKS